MASYMYACHNVGGSGGMLPQENLDSHLLRAILVHSEHIGSQFLADFLVPLIFVVPSLDSCLPNTLL